jgi:hypothetical protein
VPISKYYKGHGSEVMSDMKKRYGEDRGEEVFYATANKRKQTPGGHGSLEDITFHEDAAVSERICEDLGVIHPVHKGYKGGNGEDQELMNKGAIYFGTDRWEKLEMDGDPKIAGNNSALRDIGQGVHLGAPVDYFGPDTDYRAEEIDPYQYGRDYEPIPFRDYFKSEDKQFARGLRAREQDEYDETPTPGCIGDSMPHTEAYGAVNYQGAGPDKDGQGKGKAGECDYRSFRSQRQFARANMDKSMEYAVDVSGLDTKEGKNIR